MGGCRGQFHRNLYAFLGGFADVEHVPIRVAAVALAHAPWHIFGFAGDFDTLVECTLVDFVDVGHPDRHPYPFVQAVIPFGFKGRGIGAFAAAALSVEAQKNFTLAGTDSAKIHGVAPIPIFGPPEFFEPGK